MPRLLSPCPPEDIQPKPGQVKCAECGKYFYMTSLDFNWAEYICNNCSAWLQSKENA
jgi:hypothetical protein